jgi:hypothetical protein
LNKQPQASQRETGPLYNQLVEKFFISSKEVMKRISRIQTGILRDTEKRNAFFLRDIHLLSFTVHFSTFEWINLFILCVSKNYKNASQHNCFSSHFCTRALLRRTY